VISPFKGKKAETLKPPHDPTLCKKFLEALSGAEKVGDEKVRLAVEKAWCMPRDDELAAWYKMFVSAAETVFPSPL